ncbi:MAG: lipid II flippase MurJ [Ignavibacteriaceae bacterium]|nr:lipid II flippase MurJ [Ignavibacteriaceae bacterium]
MTTKKTLSIAGVSIIITLINLFSKGLGFVREMLFAGIFGLGQDYDLLLVSSVLPLTLSTILLYLGQNYFIPISNKFLKSDETKETLFLNLNILIFFIVGTILALILYLLKNQVIGLYLSNSNSLIKERAVLIFSIYLVSIPIYSVISILSAYFQQKLIFIIPAVSQLFLNLCILILVPIFHLKYGILIIPLSYNAGALIQLIYLINRANVKSFRLQDLKYFKKNLISISSSLIIVILIESIGQLFLIADRYFFNVVNKGGIAALNYALNIFLLPISIVAISIYTVIFPRLTELYTNKSYKELEIFLLKNLKLCLIIFIPVTFVFIFYNNFIITILYERGQFGIEDSIITSHALSYLSISLFIFSIYGVVNKLFYSSGMLKILLVITISSCIIKIIMNYTLVNTLSQNGLALSTSITYFFLFVVSLFVVSRKLHIKKLYNIYLILLFLMFNGLVSITVVEIVSKVLSIPVHLKEILKISLFVVVNYNNLVVIDYFPVGHLKNILPSLKN